MKGAVRGLIADCAILLKIEFEFQFLAPRNHMNPLTFSEVVPFLCQEQQTKGGDLMSSGINALKPQLVRATGTLEQPLASA